MGSDVQKPEYTGMDKYPGWIATILTIIIGVVFIGALANEANHDAHHDDAHGEKSHEKGKAAPADKEKKKEGKH